jgi:hypothetical protein
MNRFVLLICVIFVITCNTADAGPFRSRRANKTCVQQSCTQGCKTPVRSVVGGAVTATSHVAGAVVHATGAVVHNVGERHQERREARVAKDCPDGKCPLTINNCQDGKCDFGF